MKWAKEIREPERRGNTFYFSYRAWSYLFLALIPLLGCAPQTTFEIQKWGIVGEEIVYDTTVVTDKNGVILEETRTPAGTVPIYGHYTEEVVIDPETRDSHDVFAKTYRGVAGLALSTAVTYILLSAF